jgi:hypothetical protein
MYRVLPFPGISLPFLSCFIILCSWFYVLFINDVIFKEFHHGQMLELKIKRAELYIKSIRSRSADKADT